VGDTVESQTVKLKAMRALLEKKMARMNGQPDPHPNMYNDILDPVPTPIGAPAPAGAPSLPKAAATGVKPKVATVDDYNKLKSGTVYIDPNGIEKVKK